MGINTLMSMLLFFSEVFDVLLTRMWMKILSKGDTLFEIWNDFMRFIIRKHVFCSISSSNFEDFEVFHLYLYFSRSVDSSFAFK